MNFSVIWANIHACLEELMGLDHYYEPSEPDLDLEEGKDYLNKITLYQA